MVAYPLHICTQRKKRYLKARAILVVQFSYSTSFSTWEVTVINPAKERVPSGWKTPSLTSYKQKAVKTVNILRKFHHEI